MHISVKYFSKILICLLLNMSMNIIIIKYLVIRNFRVTCSSVKILKGYILICWNAKGVHARRRVENPCNAI